MRRQTTRINRLKPPNDHKDNRNSKEEIASHKAKKKMRKTYKDIINEYKNLWSSIAHEEEEEPEIIRQFGKDTEMIPPLNEHDDSDEDEDIQCLPCKPRPTLPSAKEIEEHNLTHSPYRSWCSACVLGQARNDPHKREAARTSTIPILSIQENRRFQVYACTSYA